MTCLARTPVRIDVDHAMSALLSFIAPIFVSSPFSCLPGVSRVPKRSFYSPASPGSVSGTLGSSWAGPGSGTAAVWVGRPPWREASASERVAREPSHYAQSAA